MKTFNNSDDVKLTINIIGKRQPYIVIAPNKEYVDKILESLNNVSEFIQLGNLILPKSKLQSIIIE